MVSSHSHDKKDFIKKILKNKKVRSKKLFRNVFKTYFWGKSSKDFHLKLKNVENQILNGNPYQRYFSKKCIEKIQHFEEVFFRSNFFVFQYFLMKYFFNLILN